MEEGEEINNLEEGEETEDVGVIPPVVARNDRHGRGKWRGGEGQNNLEEGEETEDVGVTPVITLNDSSVPVVHARNMG